MNLCVVVVAKIMKFRLSGLLEKKISKLSYEKGVFSDEDISNDHIYTQHSFWFSIPNN